MLFCSYKYNCWLCKFLGKLNSAFNNPDNVGVLTLIFSHKINQTTWIYMAKSYFLTPDQMMNSKCTYKVPQSSRKSGSGWKSDAGAYVDKRFVDWTVSTLLTGWFLWLEISLTWHELSLGGLGPLKIINLMCLYIYKKHSKRQGKLDIINVYFYSLNILNKLSKENIFEIFWMK